MNVSLWLRFAARDLRSGLQGFWIFLTCLTLGTAAIAIIGSLSASIERGLDQQGQPLLGGDVEFSLIHREATNTELNFIAGNGIVSKVATLRAMAVAPQITTLVEIKAADSAYPLYGTIILENNGSLQNAIALQDGAYGVAADPLLLGRLGVSLGDKIKVGSLDVAIRGIITAEPDRISDGFILGPRLLMSEDALKATGLIQPGSHLLSLPREAGNRPRPPGGPRSRRKGKRTISRCRLAIALPQRPPRGLKILLTGSPTSSRLWA